MARPQRNNVDYFPFLCDEGTKMYYIEETYGNDGFATFIKILRELAKTDYHYLDLSKKTTLMFLSAKCKVSVETLNTIIKDLVDLEKFDSQLWSEANIIWCQDFIDSIQDAYFKRSNDCITRNELVQLLIGKGILKPSLGSSKPSKSKTKGPVKPQSIEEETILNKKKVNIDVFESSLIDLGIEKNLVDEFIKVRKTKKCVNTLTAFQKLKKEIELSGRAPNEIVKMCVEKSWGGFEAQWLNNTQTKVSLTSKYDNEI